MFIMLLLYKFKSVILLFCFPGDRSFWSNLNCVTTGSILSTDLDLFCVFSYLLILALLTNHGFLTRTYIVFLLVHLLMRSVKKLLKIGKIFLILMMKKRNHWFCIVVWRIHHLLVTIMNKFTLENLLVSMESTAVILSNKHNKRVKGMSL